VELDKGNMGVGLLGLGTVGQGVARLLAANREEIARKAGCGLVPVSALVRDGARQRSGLPDGLRVTSDPGGFADDPSVNLVVDAMGGVEPARRHVLRALGSGRPVVMANKQLLATCGQELFGAAAAAGVDLLFEASVCSGVPVLRALREGLAGDRVTALAGVLNGTTNYILTRMERGASFAEAIAEAQSRGIAEADPAADLEGRDAAWKLAILASTAFGVRVRPDMVETTGLDGVTRRDLEVGGSLGLRLKLLATARSDGDGGVEARVEPAFVKKEHALAQVEGEDNAVLIDANAAGKVMLSGPGAGGNSAAAAIVSDLIEAARNLRLGVRRSGCGCRGDAVKAEEKPLRSVVIDTAGAAGRLAACGIGFQHCQAVADVAVLITAPARRAELEGALGRDRGPGRAGQGRFWVWDGG